MLDVSNKQFLFCLLTVFNTVFVFDVAIVVTGKVIY